MPGEEVQRWTAPRAGQYRWSIPHPPVPPVIPRGEVEGYYGTSGDLDPRGYWMRIDVESDQGLAGETKS